MGGSHTDVARAFVVVVVHACVRANVRTYVGGCLLVGGRIHSFNRCSRWCGVDDDRMHGGWRSSSLRLTTTSGDDDDVLHWLCLHVGGGASSSCRVSKKSFTTVPQCTSCPRWVRLSACLSVQFICDALAVFSQHLELVCACV